MTLEEMASYIEARCVFPLLYMMQNREGYYFAIGARAPNGEEVGNGFSVTKLEMAQNSSRRLENLLAVRIYEASSTLERFLASFDQQPKWDGLAWGE